MAVLPPLRKSKAVQVYRDEHSMMSVPGDGAAVGLVARSDRSPILDVECRTYGEFAGDMTIAVDPPRKWWAAGPGEGGIGLTESKITTALARGNRQVPAVSYAVCD